MTNIPSVQASNGMFSVTGAGGKTEQLDLGTLMLMINIERTKNLDQQLALQIGGIQDRNNMIREYTELLSACRQIKADGKDDGSPTAGRQVTINGKTLPLQGPSGTESWANKLGFEWSDCYGDRPTDAKKREEWNAHWEANINAIKGKIDNLNNDSQIDNLRLQQLMEKRNNAFEMATKVMDTNNQSLQSILRNL